MKKSSVSLSEAEASRLARLAEQLGRSRSEVVRLALAAYQPPVRVFHLDGCFEGDGSSVADVADDQLLHGFAQQRPAFQVLPADLA